MNGKADALTRRSGDLPTDEDERILQQSRVDLKPENFLEVHTSNIPCDPALDEPISEPALSEINDNDFKQLKSEVIQSRPPPSLEQAKAPSNEVDLVDLDELWKLAYANLEAPMHEVITSLQQNNRQHPIFRKLRLSMADCQFVNGRLFYRNRMYIPDHPKLRLHLIQQAHNSPSGGHGGKSRTFEILSRHYFCPGLTQLVRRFVRNCEKCSRSKASNEKYNGLLHPLPVPLQAWKEVALDLLLDCLK